MTQQVKLKSGPEQDTALRFLTHFLGDVHQPLHLTGRYYGGNLVPVLFNGKETSLHKAWDDDLIPERMKLLGKYTEPLPTGSNPAHSLTTLIRNQEIESALTGSEYDPLVRWIVLEGIDGWWAAEHKEWTTCPQLTMGYKPDQKVLGLEKTPSKDLFGVPVCPYHWAEPSHQLLCNFVWREDFVGVENSKDAIYEIEINTPEYAGRIRDEKMVEKQLALGGMRLAGVLNAILGSDEEKRSSGVIPGVY